MDQRVIEYVRKHSKRGFSHSEIEGHLVRHGWRREDAKDAVNFVKGEQMLDEVKRKNYGYENQKFINTSSSIALMFFTFFIAALIVGGGIFLLNSNFITGMATRANTDAGVNTAVQEKAPVVESAKEIKTNVQPETAMRPYTFNAYDWNIVPASDVKMVRLEKNNAAITVAQLNSNGMNLVDYFDSVYSILLITSVQGNEILGASDIMVNSKKAKKLLRTYQQDGKTIKLQQVYFEHNGFIYLVNYEAEQPVFDKNLNSANDVIETMQFN